MKAEEYEAAVDKVLAAFNLAPGEVTAVDVAPHRTIVTKLKIEDGKRVTFNEVIDRDDVKAGSTFSINGEVKDIAALSKTEAQALVAQLIQMHQK